MASDVSETSQQALVVGTLSGGTLPPRSEADAVVEHGSDAAPQAEQAYAKTAARSKVTKARSAAKRRFVYADASDGDALGTPGAITQSAFQQHRSNDASRLRASGQQLPLHSSRGGRRKPAAISPGPGGGAVRSACSARERFWEAVCGGPRDTRSGESATGLTAVSSCRGTGARSVRSQRSRRGDLVHAASTPEAALATEAAPAPGPMVRCRPAPPRPPALARSARVGRRAGSRSASRSRPLMRFST